MVTTIENKKDIKSLEQVKLEQFFFDFEPINLSLKKCSAEISVVFNYLSLHRDEEFLWDLMLDVIERMEKAVSESSDLENGYYK